MILVAGATGLLGSGVCRRLAARGHRVRALTRPTSAPEKIADLRNYGAETCTGDLRDPESLVRALDGVDAVVSTATAIISHEAGNTLAAVDEQGQLDLVAAAKEALVDRFVFVSFPPMADLPFPRSQAKQRVENALAGMNYTVLRATCFMEIWLSPLLGFDWRAGRVRIHGRGANPLSWVSAEDVAEMCAIAVEHPAAFHSTIEFGGPEALTALDVVRIFEEVTGRSFAVDHLPEEALRSMYDAAQNPVEKTFAGLMLHCARGYEVDMTETARTFGLHLTSVRRFVERLGAARAAEASHA